MTEVKFQFESVENPNNQINNDNISSVLRIGQIILTSSAASQLYETRCKFR